ncbi:MAG: reverse transcriptase family protein [Clostridiaceae bacterium]
MYRYNYTKRLLEGMQSEQYSDIYIEACCKYAENLLDRNLPVIFEVSHLDEILKLKGIVIDFSYHTFEIDKKNGDKRFIIAPSKKLKYRQQWILKNILEKILIDDSAHGFKKNKSIVTNAQQHINKKYIINIDIKDFFPSIGQEKVYEVFKSVGYTEEVARKLAHICCFGGVLPQGAPTSPCLSNIILKELDIAIKKITLDKEITYTRYADDLTFSANFDITYLTDMIYLEIEKQGFIPNKAKTNIMQANRPKIVTGLIVSEKVKVPKKYKRKLRQEIYYCKKFGVANHLFNIESKRIVNYKEYLYGKAYFIKMVEKELGEKFLEELDSIRWE